MFKKRVIILVVDRDDDVGQKTGQGTPLIGRDNVLDTAVKLSLADPEEADANAMYAAVKLYDELSGRSDMEVGVAVIAGSRSGDVQADIKLSKELDDVNSSFKIDECIVVTDGPLEQQVYAMISSRAKISSVRTVIVKQSPGIEQTWLLLARYVRMVMFDPRYAKLFLGMPGVLLVIIGILQLLSLFNIPVLLAIVGLLLLIRGFNIDQAFSRVAHKFYILPRLKLISQVRIFTFIAALIILGVAINVGGGKVAEYVNTHLIGAPSLQENPTYWLGKTPILIGTFINASVDVMLVAALLTTSFNIFYYLIVKSTKVWRYIQSISIIVVLWIILRVMSDYFIQPDYTLLTRLIVVSIVGFLSLTVILIGIRSIRLRVASYQRRRLG
ncbi:MAG: DUF373 family protein [Nitrososphaerota archaeon]|nr:DUF373 family protein [Nitrososphaerota archaeon]